MTEVQGENLIIEEIQPLVPEAVPEVSKKKVADKGGFWWGTGRRKSSVARVRIKPGSGKLIVNKKELTDYFRRVQDQNNVLAPLKLVDAVND
jgi:small subunit ribosomal protein S9